MTISYLHDASLSFPENPTDFTDQLFSEKFACNHCGISIPELEPRLFSFNSPQGACPACNGLGSILKIDQEKIIASSLSLSEGAIIPFASVMGKADTWWGRLVQTVVENQGHDFRKTPFELMDSETQNILLHGSPKVYEVHGTNRFGKETVIHQQFEGFITNLERRYSETDSDFMRHEIEQYMTKHLCAACSGDRPYG